MKVPRTKLQKSGLWPEILPYDAVIKVQGSLAGQPAYLIYDEPEEVFLVSAEYPIPALADALQGRPKAYFRARFELDGMALGAEVQGGDW